MTDAANERMIQRCYLRMIESPDFGLRMHWWHRMAHYIRRRPSAQIRRMERAMGLA